MIKRAVLSKLRQVFTLLLLICVVSQSVATPVSASSNGNQTSSDNNADVVVNYLTSMQQNLAVMLYDGVNREFVMDRDELTGSVAAVEPGTGYKTEDYVKYQNANYKNMSVSKAYAQIFQRTQVSWTEESAKASLMLLGPDNYWGRNPGEAQGGPGGITYNAMGDAWGKSMYQKHRMGYDPYGCKAKLYTHNLKYGWAWTNKTRWTKSFDEGDANDGKYKDNERYIPSDSDFYEAHPNGNGLFKNELVDYLKTYFDEDEKTKVDKKPDKFFQSLVDKATTEQKRTAYRIWAYIAAGAESIAEGVEDESPNRRWTKVFEGEEATFNADEIFIGDDGIYELKDGVESYINGYEDPRVLENVGSYLDTLLSLYLVAELNDKPKVAKHYLKAAKDAFGKAGSYVTRMEDIIQTKSIIFDTWTTQCYNNAGNAIKGTVVTHTDNWGMYLNAFHSDGKTPVTDFRSNNPIYNDYASTQNYKASMAEESVKYKAWSSKIEASTDRIGIRLSLLDLGNMSDKAKNMLNDTKVDISVNSVFNPGLSAYGVTAASLGRMARDTKNDTILAGLKNYRSTTDSYSHGYKGLGTAKLDMVGGQFAIFMFAQGTRKDGEFLATQNLTATVGDKESGTVEVEPNVDGLKKTIKLVYTLGNDIKPASKTTKQASVSYNKMEFDKTYSWLTYLKKMEDVKLYARTYVTKQVTEYKLDTLWIADNIGNKQAVVHTAGIKPDVKYKDLPAIKTELGYNTIAKSKFASDTKGWSEVSLSDYKAFMTSGNMKLFTYKDTSFKEKTWAASNPMPKKDVITVAADGGRVQYTYTPGYDYCLKIEYVADTQFKIAKTKTGASYYKPNYTKDKGDNLDELSASERKASPIVYSKNVSNKKYEPVTDTLKFKAKKKPKLKNTPLPPDELKKESMTYAVYSSSPEAYAELKNWGVASTNEPGDTTGLGDGRSPVDTQLGVSGATASNGSSVINEDYEAMAGVPSTEKLYLAVGGSEFIVDIAVQYVPNETSVRTYVSHFDSVKSQYNYASASGAGGDIPDDSVWGNYVVPQPKGLKSGVTATVTTSNGGKSINPHDGGTYTLEIKGTIHNDGVDGKKVISDHDGGTYPYNYGNGRGSDSNFAPRAEATVQGSNGSGSQLTAAEAAKGNGMPLVGASTVTRVPNTSHDSPVSFAWAVPRVSDVEAFNDSMDDTVKQWIDDMVQYFENSPSFKAGSDGITRKFGDGKVGEFTYTKDKLQDNIVGYPILSADSGSLTVTPPSDLFRFDGDRVAGDSFNIVSFKTNDTYDVTNPANKTATATSSNNGTLRTISYEIKAESKGKNYSITTIPGTGNPRSEDTYRQDSTDYSNSKSWSGTITGKWTDGYDVEWFSSTSEGQAEYNAFVAKYNADLSAANAWVASESAKRASTGSGGLKTGVGDVSASISKNAPVYDKTTFVADTGSGTAVARKDGDYDWSASYTFTVKPHTLCGPECGHVLPEINDVWQQSFNYDYLKIIGLSVLRLDQGAASDSTDDETGLKALIGTSKLGVTRQTYYSSPTMNLAQANIFNYMGLQTDGKKDVNKATNEYFRSIATGVGTPWGNTRSSEANRVRYFITNEDGSKLTAKGPTFERLTYEGNTAKSVAYANEVLSAWGEGAVKADDVVVYNFGPRSNISDGTSRGYKYNVNKTSWIENVDGAWRGKAAYDLPWAKGFIYDGVQEDGKIDASGFSVSRLYRNSATSGTTGQEGIIQEGVKGWQGKGMTQTTLKYTTEAYERDSNGLLFKAEFYPGSSTSAVLKQPAVRDWSTAQHTAYVDTRNALNPAGGTMPGAEDGDIAPSKYVAKWWEEHADKSKDTLAQTQPYNTKDMLKAYTNTASDGGAKIRATSEYKLMQAKRNEKVQATVISDALVLDLPNGLQPIMYHYKNASKAVAAEDRIPDTRSTFEELWLNNLFTPNSWSDTPTGSIQDGIILGSYNGDLTKERVTGVNDVQKRLQWHTDEVPATPNMFIQTKDATVESPTGVIGSKLGAKVLNGTNINLYLAHNKTASTRVLSLPVTNKAAVGATTQRTLLYNVTPMELLADNREYETGVAEAFWETIVQWKDSSNHDYYGKFVDDTNVKETDVYLPAGSFIRLPELLGNYGQIQRPETADGLEEAYSLVEETLKGYFVDKNELEAYGASEAREAQLEQYQRGFGVTGYNYDTTNNLAIDGKYHKNMYNQSSDLTEAAKGEAYGKDGKLGVPFLLDGVTDANFNTETANRSVGALGTGVAKTGYIQQAAYSKADIATETYELNEVVVHTPISARSVQLMPLADWKDQRTYGQSLVSTVRNQVRTGCPGIVELCEHSYLDDKYDKSIEILRLNLIGSGNSVVNTAANAVTTGNIIFAGNYAMTSEGLSSNGSARTGVSLSALGGSYYSSLDYQVTSKITYVAGTGEQMLFGFEEYGITLNTDTKKLAIRVSDAMGYVDVEGIFNSGDTLKVQFGCNNASLSKVWVNDELRMVSLVDGATFETMTIGTNQVGDVFYIGAWETGIPTYLPTESTKYQSVLLERLAGSRTHTLACMSTVTHHVGGNNTHIHAVEDLGASDSKDYLNGSIQAWNNFEISDATLRERLGDILWSTLGLPKVTTTEVINENVSFVPTTMVNNFGNVGTSLYVVPYDGEYYLETWGASGGGDTPRTTTVQSQTTEARSQAFDFTGGVQTFTAPVDGTYTLEVWGAQGGGYGSHGNAPGGYSTGKVTLAAGQTIYIGVGGKGKDERLYTDGTGFNGGGSPGYDAKGGGGGATHIATANGVLSSLAYNRSAVLLVAGGGGSNGYWGSTGVGGGLSGGNSADRNGYVVYTGGTQTNGSYYGQSGTFGQGGSGRDKGGSGGGGWFGGAGMYDDYGGGGGSAYIGGVAEGATVSGVRYGNGYAVVSWSQTVNHQSSGPVGSVGGLGGYSAGYVTLKKGDVLSVNVGGQGTMAAGGTFSGGGFNGGGHGANYGYGGGGATDVRVNGFPDRISNSNKYIGRFTELLTSSGNPIQTTLSTGETAIKFAAGTQHTSAWVQNVFKAGHTYQISLDAWTTSDSDMLYVDAFPDTLPEASFRISSQRKTYTTTLGSSLSEMEDAFFRIFANSETFRGDVYVTNVKVLDMSAASLDSRVIVAGGGGGADDITGEIAGTLNDGSGGFGGAWGGPASINGTWANIGSVDGNMLSYADSLTNATTLGNWANFYASGSGTTLTPDGWYGIKLTRTGYGDSGAYLYVPGLQPNTEYILSGSIKSTGGNDGNGALLVVNQSDSLQIARSHMQYSTNGGYNGITLKFNSGANTGVYLRLNGVDSGTMWVRSLVLKKVSEFGGEVLSEFDNGNGLGQGASASVMLDTGGAGGGYYGGYVTNHPNGGGSGGTSYVGGVTRWNMQNGVRSGNGYAVITAPNKPTTKSYTFEVTGSKKYLDVTATRTSGAGNVQLSVYKGDKEDASKLLYSTTGYPNAVLPENDNQMVLSAGKYTVVVKSTDANALDIRLKATLTGRNLSYADIMALPTIDGAEAWRQIPYYLPNGNRNPVYACNGELNTHVEEIPRSTQFSYTGEVQTFTAPQTGTYTIETWGAQGGGNDPFSRTIGSRGGAGGYSKGNVTLTAGQTIYIYVGGQGTTTNAYGGGGWNGGGATQSGDIGNGPGGGGGATDVRTSSDGNWQHHLDTRIIVAGGGGGADDTGIFSDKYGVGNDGSGGHGGGTSGTGPVSGGSDGNSRGGSQVSGGTGGAENGTFGKGGNNPTTADFGGGGGGYYGGASGGGTVISGVDNAYQAGGGGSGYIGGVTSGKMLTGIHTGDGLAKISWNEPTMCYTEVNYDNCTEPHHTGGHYDGDPLCYSPCMDDSKHNNEVVQNRKVNTPAASFVSVDWDYTLYADSLDAFRMGDDYQLEGPTTHTGLGYYDVSNNGEFDAVRFVRGKYVKFPWITLYDGVLYSPGEWIVLGDRGDYAQGKVTVGNTDTGFGGNVQSGSNGEADIWDGEQAAEYNVQNWSNYNQQIYKDLYKDFYDFYLPVTNNEMSLADIVYATVAVNSPVERDEVTQAGNPAAISSLADVNEWMKGTLANNRVRDLNSAVVGAAKVFYVDVVGRIGGLVIEDTTDVKFSNTFKQALAPVSDSKITYDIDTTDLGGVKAGRITKALQMSNSIAHSDKLEAATDSLSARAILTETSDWVGFTYDGGNARKYILTVDGNKLKSGELRVEVTDASNGDYTLRLSDMTLKKQTDSRIEVEFDVKQTSAAVTIQPRFTLLDVGVPDVYVSSMTVAIGGSGFSQGLNKVVDETKQNFYVTDLTDVRGVYLNPAANTSSAVEGASTLGWERYSSYATFGDWVRISSATQVRDANNISQRTTPEYGTRAVNTYGTRPWVQENDPLYKALASVGGKALLGPLTAKDNVIPQYKNSKDQLAVGSKLFFDVTTVGSYASEYANLKIIPTYYMIDVNRRDENGAVALIPVDIYQFSSSGNYQPVNIFGAPYGGFTSTELDKFNQYRLSINWEEEAVANKNRRMVTNEEYQAAKTYSDLFCENVYDIDPYTYPGLDLSDTSTYPKPSGKTESSRKLPSGVMQIGGSQFIQQNYQTQTYIGSNFTYGVDKSGGLFAPYAADPTQSPKYIYWQTAAQRWHSTIGLPSDSVFVPLAQDPVTHKFVHRPIADITANAVDINENYIICYLDIYAEGTVWTLHYDNQQIQRKVTINGTDYDLPVNGPVGPATANPYPGQTSVGTETTNEGIPIGVFGGTRVEGQADIIKVN